MGGRGAPQRGRNTDIESGNRLTQVLDARNTIYAAGVRRSVVEATRLMSIRGVDLLGDAPGMQCIGSDPRLMGVLGVRQKGNAF